MLTRFLPLAALLSLSCVLTNAWGDDAATLSAAYERGLQEYKADRFATAAPLFRQALALAPRVFGPGKHGPIEINTATLSELVGLCELELLELGSAEQRFLACIQVGEREESAPSPLALRCKNNLAELYQRLHQFARSEKLSREVLRDQADPKERANSASNLAYVLLMQDRLPEATQFFTTANNYFQTLAGAEGELKQALVTHGLGMIAHKQGRARDAEKLFRRALAARERHLPAAHRFVAHSKGMLAATLASQGNDRAARPLLEEALEAMRRFWGDEHPDVAMELHELGLVLDRLGDRAGALGRLTESRQILRKYQLRTLRLLPEEAQLRFLDEERARFQDVLAVAWQSRNENEAVQASLEWVLNEKGLAHEALAERQLVARAVELNPTQQAAARELQQVRQELVALAGAGKNASLDKAAAASRREAELLVRLGRRNAPAQDNWFRWPQVQAALDVETALIEIVRLERETPRRSVFDARPSMDRTAARYLAWVVVGGSERVQLVDLGPAAPIDALVQRVRETIAADATDHGRLKTLGEMAAMEALHSEMAQLAGQILQPLKRGLNGKRQLVLSPDGALWLVPWAALPMEAGTPSPLLLEQCALRYEISGRNLLRPTATATTRQAPVVFADPSYDLGRSESAAALAQVLSNPTRQPPADLRSASLRSLGELPKFGSLPFAAAEAEAIAPHLQRFAGQTPLVYRRRYALEGIAKAIHQPAVISFITHGFFLADERPDASSANAAILANPLLRCGLVLAGCNDKSSGGAGSDDGILTGLEVVGLDLRGTKLAVLSACETGVGQVNASEGVAGLRQAFQLAGAEAVASTLWQIPDRESALLMERFFEHLAAQKTNAAALREAQLERIAKRREKYGAAHPLFWAAWTITGG